MQLGATDFERSKRKEARRALYPWREPVGHKISLPQSVPRMLPITLRWTPGEVAKLLGVSRQQIDKWLRAGQIPHETLVNGDRLMDKKDAKKPVRRKPGPKPVSEYRKTQKKPKS